MTFQAGRNGPLDLLILDTKRMNDCSGFQPKYVKGAVQVFGAPTTAPDHINVDNDYYNNIISVS